MELTPKVTQVGRQNCMHLSKIHFETIKEALMKPLDSILAMPKKRSRSHSIVDRPPLGQRFSPHMLGW